MTVLPTVRHQIDAAAQRLAADAMDHPSTGRGAVVRRLWVARLVRWTPVVTTVVVVLVVIAAAAQLHGRTVTRTPAAQAGGPGLTGVFLGPNQAWHVIVIEQDTTPWQPPSTSNTLTPSGTVVTASTRAAVVSRTTFENWTLRSGVGRGDGHVDGKPRFIGSAAERALWRSDGSRPSVTLASGTRTTSQQGFEVGNRSFSYAQLTRFPNDPTAVLRLFPATGVLRVANQVSEIASTLEEVPLPTVARRAIFNALAGLAGVQHLGAVHDPLGRPGVAFATVTPAERVPTAGPGSTAGAPLPLSNELIFDPRTDALLASETVLLRSSPVNGIGAGYPISWTAYVTSMAVPTAAVPKVAAPPCAQGTVRLSLSAPASGATGEHAYLFALTNLSSSPCTLDGYPHVTLSSGAVALRFADRNGGGRYVTAKRPRPATLQPGGRGFFLLAKYRCDGTVLHAATVMYVSHVGLGGVATLNLNRLHIGDLDYCRRYRGDQRVDPGNYVTVSPIEATAQAAAAPPP